MSPVVPPAVFLACLYIGGFAQARERNVSFAAEHEATLEGDHVRWETRVYDCGDPRVEPRRKWTVHPLERSGGRLRLEPPLLEDEPVQVVLLGDPNLVFVPNEELAPHRTRHGFEVFRPDHVARDRVVECLRERGVHLSPAALLVGTNPERPASTLEGRLVGRRDGARAVLGVSAALLAVAVGGLAVAWRRLSRRVRLEAAEAILRADIPDL
jgi:hypothetical protein